MKKEYMDRMLTWTVSTYSIGIAFDYLRFVMTGLGSPPAVGTLDKEAWLSITPNIEHLTFCTVTFTIWTRYVHAVLFSSSRSDLLPRNFELIKMKCGDITTEDIDAVNGVFLKYPRGEEKSLTINDLHVYFEIHLSNRKGWQKKSDKGSRNVHLHSASIHFSGYRVWTSLHSPGNHYKIYPHPDMGWACDPFFWVLFWMNWVKYVHLGEAMGAEEFLFPTVGRTTGILRPGEPLSHDQVQKSLDAAVKGAKIEEKFSTHCFRRGGAQYRFMSAPLGERWSLHCVRFWGGWAEGKQVSTRC